MAGSGEAVCTDPEGIPAAYVTIMRVMPLWSTLTKAASSAPHDWAVMEEFMRGEPLNPADWARVRVPTLVLAGGKSEPLLRAGARAIADALPNAEYREVPKLSHNPNVKLLTRAAADHLQ